MRLENIGAISRIDLAGNWHEKTEGGGKIGLRWERIFSPNTAPTVELGFSYRGMTLDEASRKVFSFLRKQGEKDLSIEEIMALKTVLGVATTGDNQYTNSNPETSLDGPLFHLDSIRLSPVANKLVLRVEGRFKNGRFYRGIYYPAGVEGRIVEELFLQSLNPEHFQKYAQAYEDILKSIVWR